MRERLRVRSGWLVAATVLVIGVPAGAGAAVLIDGADILPGTVRAPQLHPSQRSESWSYHSDNSRTLTASTTVASRQVPTGVYVVSYSVSADNGNAFTVTASCLVDGTADATSVKGGASASRIGESNGLSILSGTAVASIGGDNDVVRVVCGAFGNPGNTHVLDATLTLVRVGSNRHFEAP